MIHTFENAVVIRKTYEYLIDQYDATQTGITDICIIPADLRKMAHFLGHYKVRSAEDALILSGFDIKKVRIVVIYEQTLVSAGQMIDLDEYLTANGIPKSYDKVTRTFVTMN
ncbi:MAG: hypothetical protein ABIT58_04675 [Ferruginibacter sp.]